MISFKISILSVVFFLMSTTLYAHNNAPVLYPGGNPKLSDIQQDNQSSSGTNITEIIASSTANGSNMITDIDANPSEGIAVYGVEKINGGWQYTTDNGETWLDIQNISETSAILLTSTTQTKLRFVPNTGFMGNATFEFRAWDTTTGVNGTSVDITTNGGATAFSADSDTGSIYVAPNNTPSEIDLRDESTTYHTSNNSFYLDGNLTVTDFENDNITGAFIAISENYKSLEDRLSFTAMYGISGSFDIDKGAMILNGSATPEQYQEVLRSIKYSNISSTPTEEIKKVSITLGNTPYNFENGHYYEVISGARTWTSSNTDSKVKYFLGRRGYLATITSLPERQFISTKLIDPEAAVWIGATYDSSVEAFRWICGPEGLENDGKGIPFWVPSVGLGAQGNRSFTDPYSNQPVSPYNYWHPNEPNISGNYVWMGYSVAEVWDDTDDNDPVVNDGYLIEYGGFPGQIEFDCSGYVTFNVKATLDLTGIEVLEIQFSEDSDPVNLSSTISFTDLTKTVTSATISITQNYIEDEDFLDFTNANGITSSWNQETGVLTLSGTQTAENYVTALRSVKYRNDSNKPSTSTRTISIYATNSAGNSDTLTRNISITSINDLPIISNQSSLNFDEDNEFECLLSHLTVTDNDNENTELTLEVFSGTNYTFDGNTITPTENFNGVLVVNVKVKDPTEYSAPYEMNITVNPLNDPPVITDDENPTITPQATIRIGGKIGATVGTWNDNADNP
ncbi:MAG: hypothetical protein JXR48_09665 [Candidatus Delongbacteria bacterium]|nr:hypothetical protein [Candidatus Delongbacteria bacterium]